MGAGLGGLTAGALLAKSGKRVVVLDRHYLPGGNASVFRRLKRYEFDVGMHYVGDCRRGAMARILDALDLGGKMEFLELDPDGFDHLLLDDLRFRVPRGLGAYRDRLVQTFPSEVRGIDRYCGLAAAMFEELRGVALPLRDAVEIAAFRRSAPTLDKNADTTLAEVLDACTANPLLRAVLFGFGGIHAVPPSRCSAILHLTTLVHYLQGAYYPRGGGQVLPDLLVGEILRHGGEVILKRRVTRIVVRRGSASAVETDRGERLQCDHVISNADLKRTMFELIGREHLPLRFAGRIEGFRMSKPLFVLYGSTTRDLRREGFGNYNVHVLSSDDPQRALEAVDDDDTTRSNYFFFTSSSLKDPNGTHYAPPGETNFQVITVAPAGHDAWGVRNAYDRRAPAYKARKQAMVDHVLEQTERHLLPDLRSSLQWIEGATPITQERFTASTGGTSYGIENSARQFGMYRPGYRTPIRNVYVCGASTVSGHGIVGAMVSGVGAAGAIVGDGLRERVLLGSTSVR